MHSSIVVVFLMDRKSRYEIDRLPVFIAVLHTVTRIRDVGEIALLSKCYNNSRKSSALA